MNMIKKLLLGSLFLIAFTANVIAASNFVVKDVKFVGLQRIAFDTVISYLPIKRNQTLKAGDSAKIISTLYKTGFFDNVQLGRDGNVLVVTVKERPTISAVTVVGNKDIPKDKLNEAMKKLGLERGQVFKRSTMSETVQALREQYYGMGRYNATVDAQVTNLPRNRVSILVTVSEGRIAQVQDIRIIGNNVFDEETLRAQLPMSEPTLWSFFSGSDQFAQQKLEMAKHALQSYYMDHGYIMMKIDSTQVSITPDRKAVHVVFRITEGEKFTFGQYTLAGKLILPRKQLEKLVPFKAGDTFSRSKVVQANQSIGNELGDYGYAFAKVQVVPDVDTKSRVVYVKFTVQPGNKYYIRHMHFVGNPDTSNIPLRNNLLQFEGALYSSKKLNESLRNLRQLPYLKADKMSVKPHRVKGSDNQVDVDVSVEEQLSAQLQFSVGYSQSFGFLAGVSFNQANFMGTGKSFGMNVTRSAYQSVYSVSYTNPYFTYSGISHSMSAFYQNTTPSNVNLTDYSTDIFGFNDSYGFPISNYQRFSLGWGYQHIHLKTGDPKNRSKEIDNFLRHHNGTRFNQLLLTAGWNYSTLDRAILPTSGQKQNLNLVLSVPVFGEPLEYYTATYQHRAYLPLWKGFILTNYATVGYGNGYGRDSDLPFFQNYYAGGLGVQGLNRAYEPNTLGPRDSNSNPMGGDLLISTSIGLILPNFISQKVRTEIFYDTGNVFNVHSYISPQGTSVKPSFANLRHSVGVQVDWWTPLGMPLTFSLAMPIHKKAGDETRFFQFSIGGTF